MKSYHFRRLLIALFSVFLLISCGSGGGGMTAGGGIGGTGIISQGAVSAFGSIFVNGTEFDTSNAEIFVNGEKIGDGDESVLDNLDIGRVVTVEGRINSDESAVADRVVYSTNVNGPVESVSGTDPITNEKEIVVLGQTVVVNFITKFKPDTFGFDTIAEDDVIEVSGYRDFDGKIRATFIEDITDTNIFEFEVTGFVKYLNPNSQKFKINDLTVDYSLIKPGDLPVDFMNELFVEVEGELDDISGEMIATEIEPGDELDGEDGDEFEIMGFATEIISDLDIIKFKVGNQEVHVDPDSAVFVDGFPDDIVTGQKLEAEGSLEGGILFAWEIEFWKPDQIEVEGIVDEVVFNSGFPEFTFEEREDQLFQTNNETEFEDVEPDEIEVGMPIEVKGVPVDLELSVVVADKVSFELE